MTRLRRGLGGMIRMEVMGMRDARGEVSELLELARGLLEGDGDDPAGFLALFNAGPR